MTTWARKVNDVATDVQTVDPATIFHPDLATQFIEVPDGTQNGAEYKGGKWVAPTPVPEPTPEPPPAPVYPKVGPIAFQMLFKPEEAITADGLKATDKVLASFWKLIDDPRTDVVDLGLQSVQNAIEYTLTAVSAAIVAQGGAAIDVPSRKAAILSGVLK